MSFVKSIQISLILAALLAIIGCGSNQNPSTTESETAADSINIESLMAVTPAADRIEVIDFYGTHRCVTCRAIEANTKIALATYYPAELKAGSITFRTVKVDDKANAALAEEYQATGTALFLNVVKDGKKVQHIDLTNQAFDKGKEQAAWAEELKLFINMKQEEMGKI